jgi:hypothetical protein
MGRFGCTGMYVRVWAVDPNHNGGGRGAQLASLGGSAHHQFTVSIGSIYIYGGVGHGPRSRWGSRWGLVDRSGGVCSPLIHHEHMLNIDIQCVYVIPDFASTHRMCAQDHLFHTHGHKMFTDSQMSRIKYIYYTNNVFKD